ncbi:Zinc finger C2HC domain-containing protein 1C [Blastocladiella emersonii ATCC 22665]|nr:Zinc finger C2HC domain-containing protein 1C [Blastocladiella emersonii ATCC 22665]
MMPATPSLDPPAAAALPRRPASVVRLHPIPASRPPSAALLPNVPVALSRGGSGGSDSPVWLQASNTSNPALMPHHGLGGGGLGDKSAGGMPPRRIDSGTSSASSLDSDTSSRRRARSAQVPCHVCGDKIDRAKLPVHQRQYVFGSAASIACFQHIATHQFPGHLRTCPGSARSARTPMAAVVPPPQLQHYASAPNLSAPPQSAATPPAAATPRRRSPPQPQQQFLPQHQYAAGAPAQYPLPPTQQQQYAAEPAHVPSTPRAAPAPVPARQDPPPPRRALANSPPAPKPAAPPRPVAAPAEPIAAAPSSRPGTAGTPEPPPAAYLVPDDPEALPPPGAGDSRVPCSICSRKFAPDRVADHEVSCAKLNAKKRPVYNAQAMRVKGTDLEKFVQKAGGGGGKGSGGGSGGGGFPGDTPIAPRKKKPAVTGGGIRAMDMTADYVPCPSCGRKFSADAAANHIPACAERKLKEDRAHRNAAAKAGAAMDASGFGEPADALARRTKYQPPPLKKRG